MICAHRGASHRYPENSLKAFRKAVEQEADSIEIDIRQTRDGHLVACHDFNLSRLTGAAVDLPEVDLADFKKMRIHNQEPPATIEEIVSEVGSPTSFVFDIKENNLEKKILKLVSEKKLQERIILSSFDPRILANLKRLNPEIKTALIAGPFSILPLAVNICFYMRRVSEYVKSDFMHLNYMNTLYRGYRTLSDWGYKISYWTIDHPGDLRNAMSLRPEMIITNRPGLARAVIKPVAE